LVTKFLVDPKLFLHLQEDEKERAFFIEKVCEYFVKYALQKHVLPKNDETWEFNDKSYFTPTFDDVQKIIHVNYSPR
jgi:hypothetical protein